MDTSDVLLLHPPSVMDFRERAIFYGPVSDLIPSSPIFEMYPLGFLTLTEALASHGYQTRVVNLALRMMRSREFNVAKFIRRQRTNLIGIDLHWLPHCHGALGLAKICKREHPRTPIVFGGLSSTYYHQELIQYPYVDMVLRGNATEAAMLALVKALKRGDDLSAVPGLTWKRDGGIMVNPLDDDLTESAMTLTDIQPRRMIEMVIRYLDLVSVLPFDGWWKNPITAIFTVKGCSQQCLTCGSSAEACKRLGITRFPRFRQAALLAEDVIRVSRFTRGPIFLVGDLLLNGKEHAMTVARLIGEAKVTNEIVFEFFDMPSDEFLAAIDRYVPNYSIELSPESHDEEIRKKQDRSIFYSNAELERVISTAMNSRCHRVDIFFMIGLSGQTKASVMASVDYCERLFARFDERLSFFISPMGPFLDPGSSIFEAPQKFGYRVFARTLEEHRALMEEDSWEKILNYETEWMTRADMVDVTYAAAERLNELKRQYGRIDAKKAERIRQRIGQAIGLRDRLRNGGSLSDTERERIKGEIREYSDSTVCDKRELYWNARRVNFHWGRILQVLIDYIFQHSGLR